MTDDKFFERLRDDATPLRYEPTDTTWTRLQARVRDRIRRPQSTADLLARWFRPIAASIAILALSAAIGTAWFQQTHEVSNNATVDSIASASNSTDNPIDGESLGVGN